MKTHCSIATLLFLCGGLLSTATNCEACGFAELQDSTELARLLRDPNWDANANAARYRSIGPHAVTMLTRLRDELLQENADVIPALDQLIDRVAAQRHAAHSGLYWYTDLKKAQTFAAHSGKPILSLRLLGNLDEEFSCANSRFFRTTLYPNKEISALLRDKFILHWQSVRPVPRVTVDFGDGRTLQRTVTGNSIHYVTTPDGMILEALPGLYAPKPFKDWLQRCLTLHQQIARTKTQAEKQEIFTAYHRARAQDILNDWRQDMASITTKRPRKGSMAKAARAATVTELLAKTDDSTWELIAAARQSYERTLDAAAIRLIRSENPVAGRAQELSVSKSAAEDPIFRLVMNLERTIQIDTVRNEYLLHRQLHDWLAETSRAAVSNDVEHLAHRLDDLNTRVYAQLFRAPLHDPWLGLLPADAYNALDNGGVTVNELVSAASAALSRRE